MTLKMRDVYCMFIIPRGWKKKEKESKQALHVLTHKDRQEILSSNNFSAQDRVQSWVWQGGRINTFLFASTCSEKLGARRGSEGWFGCKAPLYLHPC